MDTTILNRDRTRLNRERRLVLAERLAGVATGVWVVGSFSDMVRWLAVLEVVQWLYILVVDGQL